MSFRWQSFVSIASVRGIKKRVGMQPEDSVAKFTKEKQKTEARSYSMMRLSRNMIVNHAERITW
jgi:hypothetical protein